MTYKLKPNARINRATTNSGRGLGQGRSSKVVVSDDLKKYIHTYVLEI